jgi:hypothetical protein
VRLWVMYQKRQDGDWSYEIVPATGIGEGSITLPRDTTVTEIAVAAVDLNGAKGPAVRRGL